MTKFKKIFFIFFLTTYFIVGSLNSINSGISFDERHEEANWNFHTNLIKQLSDTIFYQKKFDKNKFEKEVQSFVGYGIGFQIISQPIQSILKNILILDKNLDDYGAKLLAKHFVVFLFFFFSGFFFYLILKKLIDNESFCILGLILYLTYPYLFGQSMFSPKDVPFMSIWLLCTYVSFILFEKIIEENNLKFQYVIVFSICSAYLLSIRIAGSLIFLQYLITLIIYLNIYKINFIKFLTSYYKHFLIFFIFLAFFIFLFYPILWVNPFLLIQTFEINASHFNNVGTTTLGEIMYSKDLPSTYLLIWFLVKIPLVILLGILILPLTEKKIFNDKKKGIFFGTLLLSILSIFLILVFKKVHLYDEIRQVMFLVPLFFIIGLTSLFIFSKKFFYFIVPITILFFIVENIKINPYQYVWFNLPSRTLDLNKNFELEYQGISGREISKHLNTIKTQELCILANPMWSVKTFLNNSKFNCFDSWQKIETNYKRPFLAVQNVRNLRRSMPYKCNLIYETSFKFFFHQDKIVTGKLLKCEK